MKRTRWRKRCAAIAMSLSMVLSSFSGIPVYADEGEDEDPECGFYTAADMDSEHYISSSPDEGSVPYTGAYTAYFVYKNQVGDSYEGDEGTGDGAYDNRRNLSVTEIHLNSGDNDADGNIIYDYTVALGNTDESGISFVKDTATNDYTAYKLTIPADLDIYNAYVDVTYTYVKDSTEDPEGPVGCWLYLKKLQTGLVKYTGTEGWSGSAPTQEEEFAEDKTTQYTGMAACDLGSGFFSIATVDSDNETSYADVDVEKLSIQKKVNDGWQASTEGKIWQREDYNLSNYFFYTFTGTGTYAIAYTDNGVTSRVIADVSEFDSGYVTDPTNFAGSYIGLAEDNNQEFLYESGKNNTLYFVFKTSYGKSISKDSSGNVLLYRWNDDAHENTATTIDGLSVSKDTAHTVDGYEIYKITLDDSYDFEGGFILRLFGEGEDAEPDDRYINVCKKGLNIVEPQWDDDGNFAYPEDAGLRTSREFDLGADTLLYFVTKSETGTARYSSELKVQTLDGDSVDSTVVTIEKSTDSSDSEGLYKVRFDKEGTYRIVAGNSYVTAYVSSPDVAYYTSKEINADNRITGTYTYQEGKGSLYLAIANNTEGYTITWSEDLSNGSRTNAEALEEYGLTATKVTDGTEGFDIYELKMKYGFITEYWMELYVKYTETDGEEKIDNPGIEQECQPVAGSLVASWSTLKEGDESSKIFDMNNRYSWVCLSTAVWNKSTGKYSYVPVKNASDITIKSLNNAAVPTVEETDVEGKFLFTYDVDCSEGLYLVTVGNSSVIFEKTPEIVRLYKADSNGQFEKDNKNDLPGTFDLTNAKTDNDRIFYAYFDKESLGEENDFGYIYVGDREAKEYYYFVDSTGKAVTTDWTGSGITKLSANDVTVEKKEATEDGDVLLKITVSATAPANLSFQVGTIVSPVEDGVDADDPWIEEWSVFVTKVTTEAKGETLAATEDGGKITITDVPSIEELNLATNLNNSSSLSEADAESAQEVKVTITTDVIDVEVDKEGKVTDASVEALPTEQKTAVKAILKEKDSILSSSYSATFLDLSITATVTKTTTNESGSAEKGDSVDVKITKTSEPFTIKVPIPTAQQDKKGFSIIRYHDGKTERLEATVVYSTSGDKKPLYLEFQTDRFSTYALAYREPEAIDSVDFSKAEWKVTDDNNTFSYDGNAKKLDVKVSGVDKDCTFTFTGDTATETGTYTVKVSEITYDEKTYPASTVDLPGTITKGYTWTILAANLATDADDTTVNPTPSPAPTGNPDDTTDKTDTPVDKTGAKITENADGKKIIVNANGEAITSSKVTIDKKSYITDKDGVILTNQVTTTPSGNLVYVNKNGVIVKGKVITTKDGKKYYAKASGALAVNGFCKTKYGNKVYADKNGVLKVNKVFTVNGKKYYAKASGAIATTGFVKTAAGNTVYATKSGVLKVNKVFTVNGKKYVADKNGKIVKGKKITIGSYTYTTDKKGVIKTKTKKK